MASKNESKIHREALLRTVKMLLPFVKRHKLLVTLGLLALMGDVVFRILEPWPVKYAVDTVSEALGAQVSDVAATDENVGQLIAFWAIALALIVGGRAMCNYASTIAFARTGVKVVAALRVKVFAHIQSLSLRYHSNASVGDTSQRLVGDMGRLQEVAVTAGLPMAGNLLTLVALFIVVIVLNPMLAVIVLITGVAYMLVSRALSPKITSASRQTRQGEGRLVGDAAEALAAIRVVQAYGLEDTVASGFAAGNNTAVKAGIRARRLAAQLERSTDLFVGVATAVVLGFGGWQVLSGMMTPGDMVLFLMYLKIAMKPLRDMAKYTGRIARATASGERIADLLDEPIEIQDPPDPMPMRQVSGDIRYWNISAADGRGVPLFEDLNLQIPAGQRVGLLGPSGAGKSTLAGYLMRLADPDSGSVLVDGYSTRSVAKSELRGNIAVLLQESVLFSTSIADNIRHGRPGATDEEVVAAARRAGAHDFIMRLPDEYQTELGNRGDTLSGGQRQRVAIARALIRDAPIVLLDEPTTGLDPASKSRVETSLRELTRGRTTVAITHDLSMIQSLDRVLWLEHGTIIEDGAPEQLLTDPDSQLAQWAATQRGAAEAGVQAASEHLTVPQPDADDPSAPRPSLPRAHDVLIPARKVISA